MTRAANELGYPMRIIPFPGEGNPLNREAIEIEWLLANGLGGYAAGTACGALTRRFHGLLVAALPSPLGRTSMLSRLGEVIQLPDGTRVPLGVDELDRPESDGKSSPLVELRLECGLPIFRYKIGNYVIEKRICVVRMQNTVHVFYRLVEGEGSIRLDLYPSMCFRAHEGALAQSAGSYSVLAAGLHYEMRGPAPYPALRLRVLGGQSSFTLAASGIRLRYRVELERGYDHAGDLHIPGVFHAELSREEGVTVTASTEEWDTLGALPPQDALEAEGVRRRRLLAIADPRLASGVAAELVLAADAFVIVPGSRPQDAVRARASGDELRAVIAGYHWFTDWGRDTMIALEGLTLVTGRHSEAAFILRAFARYVRDGLIPNLFPEGESEGLYHTADASLWYFHAVARYLKATSDFDTVERLVPALRKIADAHLQGTRFGIGVDPADGLLRQGAAGYQLTWMDAKVEDWVVTPRRGKPVEINALFFNALSHLATWLEDLGDPAAAGTYRAAAVRVETAFNQRFWCAERGHCYDVVDGEAGDDAACRPNQLFAIALDHPVLARDKWSAVLEVATQRLLTPVGLRSLSPGHPDYVSRYFGDLRARDAAYHQGTVWAFLLGTFYDVWRKVKPDDHAGLHGVVKGLLLHLSDACVGQVSEIFDAEDPFSPRGCAAQAWSVAELLRCLTMLPPQPSVDARALAEDEVGLD